MTLFSSLDGVLKDFMSSSLPRICRHDARLEVLEEKVEILASWFNELHMSHGLEVAKDSGHLEAGSSYQHAEREEKPSSMTLVSGMYEQSYLQDNM